MIGNLLHIAATGSDERGLPPTSSFFYVFTGIEVQ
jgi:hypothetical protein